MIAACYPQAPRPFIDLSTGINPYPYVFSEIEPEWFHRLAEHVQVANAHQAAAEYYHVENVDTIALASGMQPLMFALAALRFKEYGISNIAVFLPTYSEHEHVWRAMNHSIVPVKKLMEAAGNDVVIICNPNNPDGRIISASELITLAEELATHNGWLIVDESFADIMPELSISSRLQHAKNIVVMRSCGKFFGAAGLRVSSAITPKPWAEWLRVVVGPWPISTLACHVVPTMFSDKKWIQDMRVQLAEESKNWRNILSAHFSIVGYTDLFTLVESDDAARWHQHLMSQGILVRQFDYNPRWLRFGLPPRSALPRIEKAFSL